MLKVLGQTVFGTVTTVQRIGKSLEELNTIFGREEKRLGVNA